jgi:hypothetical protein
MKSAVEELRDGFPPADPIHEFPATMPPRNEASDEVVAVDTSITPLAVSGLVITKAALIAALQIYMPQLVDVAPIEGERFYLSAEPIEMNQPNGETNAR